VSDPEPEIDVPLDLRIGVWANDIRMLGDVEDMTLDFLRIAPHDQDAILVTRVTLPPSCILKLKSELEGF
jgi:hypothetical protein